MDKWYGTGVCRKVRWNVYKNRRFRVGDGVEIEVNPTPEGLKKANGKAKEYTPNQNSID